MDFQHRPIGLERKMNAFITYGSFSDSSCYKNMRRFFCDIHCNPKQMEFVTPKTVDRSNGLTEISVKTKYRIQERLFDSCKVRHQL